MRFSFQGNGKSLCGIQSVNVFLTLLTLGIYHFWAKVKVRRYLFSQTSCAGDRFAYHGTGRELLVGFLRALVIFGLPYAVLTIVPEFVTLSWWIELAAGWLAALVFFIYVPVAVVGARRYRMARTTWRNIQFSFRGRAWDFVKLSLKGSFLTALSLGAYYPHYQSQRQGFLVSHTYFGNARFRFDGSGWTLMPVFVATILLSIPIIALPVALAKLALAGQAAQWAWLRFQWVWWAVWLLVPVGLGQLWINFLAAKQQFLWNHTTLAGARFRSAVCYSSLRNLYAQNALLLIGTLGFAWPWVTARTAAYYLSNLTLRGTPDLAQIHQDMRAGSTTGEGLANFLDTGFEMD